MKILLDECITKKLKTFLKNHEVYTVSDMRWNGLFNGKLMTKCVENSFDILLTIDKNILYQQTINKYNVTIVVFNARNSKVSSLIPFLPSFEKNVYSYGKGKLYTIELAE